MLLGLPERGYRDGSEPRTELHGVSPGVRHDFSGHPVTEPVREEAQSFEVAAPRRQRTPAIDWIKAAALSESVIAG